MSGGPDEPAVHPGLCATCRHQRLLRSARSAFVFCGRSGDDPRFPRYPRLPVLACAGFLPREEEGARADG
jgi:hypothetical protein